MNEIKINKETVSFPFKGNKTARIHQKDKSSLEKMCEPSGVFSFEEGFETLNTMFFYRCDWLKYIILPETMRFVEQYSCVPYVKATEHKYIHHTKDDYRYPSEYAQRKMEHGWYVSKTEKIPLGLVIKSPQTRFDSCAFGDGDEVITFFLDFCDDYSTIGIKSKIIIFRPNEWHYVDGIPAPII